MEFTLGILVDNEAGVLARVASLFSRRGYNIQSLAVGPTDDPGTSWITLRAEGEDAVRVQMQRQLGKLVEVVGVYHMTEGISVERELALIKVQVDPALRGQRRQAFGSGFKNVGRDEGRHMAICMALMERDYPKMDLSDKALITKQVRAGFLFLSGVLFEPPEDFWDLPTDFISNQRTIETCAREAGFHIPEYQAKRENWRNAMLNLKGVLDKYGIPFPAIPEVGISGEEIMDVDMKDIIPVF